MFRSDLLGYPRKFRKCSDLLVNVLAVLLGHLNAAKPLQAIAKVRKMRPKITTVQRLQICALYKPCLLGIVSLDQTRGRLRARIPQKSEKFRRIFPRFCILCAELLSRAYNKSLRFLG